MDLLEAKADYHRKAGDEGGQTCVSARQSVH